MEVDGEDGRSQRARRQREERTEQIRDAALKVFADKGFHATAVSDIIEAANVARGTFYLYFPSKRALFEHILGGLLEELERGIKRVDVSPGAPPPMEQLMGNVLWLLSLPKTRPEMLQILLWEAVGLDAELGHKLDSFHRRMFEMTQRSLKTGIEMGLVRSCDTAVTARCIVGTLKEVMLSLVTRHDLDESDLETLARTLIDFSAKGILLAPG